MPIYEWLQRLRLPIGIGLLAFAWASCWLDSQFVRGFVLILLITGLIVSVARSFDQYQMRQAAPWPWPDRLLNLAVLGSFALVAVLHFATDMLPDPVGVTFPLLVVTMLPPPLPQRIKDQH